MDEDPLLWQLLLQALLIGINAFFACAEIALISMNEAKVEENAARGSKRAARLLALTKTPARFLATIQVLITLSGFLGSAFAADNFSRRLADSLSALPIPPDTLRAASLVIITLILSYITLVFGELVPKQIAMQKADELSLAAGPVIYAASIVCAPLVSLLTASADFVLKLAGMKERPSEKTLNEADIRLLIGRSAAKGSIAQAEHEIINNIFAFNDKNAAAVMTHRKDVALLRLEDSDADWEAALKTVRHNYFPVCGESEDEIPYILSARAYFMLTDKSRENVLREACVAPKFVPETVKADVLFRNMKKSASKFAIVLDEYGSMSGIVTMNDLLEELVGNFNEEGEGCPRPLIEKISSGVFRVRGAAPIEKAAEALGIALPEGGFDTFGGYVFDCLRRIPEDGEKNFLETESLYIQISEVKDHRLEEAIVRKKGQFN